MDDRATPDAAAADGAPPRWTFEDMVATAAMAVLVVITSANVLVRYLTDASFAWTEEVSVIFMVLMVFAGAAAAALRTSHIRMDLLSQRGPAAWRRLALRVGRGATALSFGLLALLLARTALDEWRFHELNTLDLPRWWITVPEALLCLLVVLRALGWGAAAEGEEAP